MGPALPSFRADLTAPPQRVLLGGLALVFAMSWNIRFNYNTEASANVNFTLPEVHWIFYALPAIFFLVAFMVGLKRLVTALRRRQRPKND